VPDLLLDALPVIDLLEITGNTSAVAQLTERDQSSVSRIYRQASERLGLEFGKRESGHYRAGANQTLLQELRRSSQRLRLHLPASLRWLGCRWSPPPGDGAASPQPLRHQWRCRQLVCQQVRDHLLDLAVLPGLDLLPEGVCPNAPPAEIPLECGCLVALPVLRQPMRLAAADGHPLHDQADLSSADLRHWPLQLAEGAGGPASQHRQRLEAQGLMLVNRRDQTPEAAPVQLLPALELEMLSQAEGLRPLALNIGLEDVDILVVRRDLRDDPAVRALITAVVESYRRCFGQRDDLQLLR
jgi:hypothetical protein